MILSLNGIQISSLKSELQKNPNKLKFAQYPGGFKSRMNESEALMILEISTNEIINMDAEMLKKKHRKCMLLNHPDKGGSPYLAMKINEAKEVLEKSYMFKK
ncbi:hypothetical protein PACTADRAFT_51306 [Pachysolen tannophilus NRRL Y-2460]|uniref:J domain-containing protein n=1 Tax=Pachysolen tannophilus NRRL Y-2460 TaxID=669874 RepID=A0A1E4TRW4_PACTA|nr:hypothetical protein PACTADRAFT_51306 [Pachysolen tannophilus NRRL Y-2460]